MAKNLKKYYQAWELRQQGKKLREIAKIMGFKSGEWARTMINHVDFKVHSNMKKSNELLKLIQKYMNIKILVSFIIFTMTIAFPSFSFAHPGNTASDGCHYCRTNCARWGYTYGTRHSHGGNTCNCNAPVDPLYCRPPTPTNPLVNMNATYTLHPNYDQETFDVDIELNDSNPTSYSVTLNKCAGCDPGPMVDFYTKKFSFVDVRPGRWYMNVKKEVGGYWSSTIYWYFDFPEWYPPPEPTSIPEPTIQSIQSKAGESPLLTYAMIGGAGYLGYYLFNRKKKE